MSSERLEHEELISNALFESGFRRRIRIFESSEGTLEPFDQNAIKAELGDLYLKLRSERDGLE